jgi:hypothetical protein
MMGKGELQMYFHAAVPITQVLSGTLSALKNVRDLAKDSSDHELKEKISETYDGLLVLKERLLEMDDEIRDLKAKLAMKASFTGPVPPDGYIYATEDVSHVHPACPRCYQEKAHVYHLVLRRSGGRGYQQCPNCNWTRD